MTTNKKSKVSEAMERDPVVLKAKEVAAKFFGDKYSSGRIAGGTVYRISIPLHGVLNKHYRYGKLSQISPEDKQTLIDLRDQFKEACAQNGINASLVDVKYHIGAGVYASVRVQIGAGQVKDKSVMGESKVGTGVTVILEDSTFRASSPKLARILRQFPHEINNFKQGQELDDDLYQELFNYYFDAGEMPYGVAKARDGDPFNWIADKLGNELGLETAQTESYESPETFVPHDERGPINWPEEQDWEGNFGDLSDLENDDDPMIPNVDEFEEDSYNPTDDLSNDEVITEVSDADQARIVSELADIGLDDGLDFFFEGNDLIVIGKATARLVISKVGGYIKSIDGEEVRISATPRERPVADKKDVDQLVAVPDSDLNEGAMSEVDLLFQEIGNGDVDAYQVMNHPNGPIETYVAGKLQEMYDDVVIDYGFHPDDDFEEILYKVCDQIEADYPMEIDEDEFDSPISGNETGLNDLRRLSGLPEVEEVEETTEVEYSNTPDPITVMTTQKMMSSGEDLNRPKKQYATTANRAANPMAEARSLIKTYDEMMKGIKK